LIRQLIKLPIYWLQKKYFSMKMGDIQSILLQSNISIESNKYPIYQQTTIELKILQKV